MNRTEAILELRAIAGPIYEKSEVFEKVIQLTIDFINAHPAKCFECGDKIEEVLCVSCHIVNYG